MNQTIKKSSVASRGKPSPARQPSANGLRRPKRCHLCQKMFAADKYQEHYQSCFRFKDSQKSSTNNNQTRANSIAGTPSLTTKASGFNTTQGKIPNNSQFKSTATQSNSNKSRLVVNNSVVVPGKATSNITRKGPHKNIVNPNIAQRKFKKDNPEEINKEEKEQEKIQDAREQNYMQESQIKNVSQIKESEREQNSQVRVSRPSSRAIRTHSRPGSATRNQPMQIRVAQQSARLANLYNQNPQRLRHEPPRFHGIEHIEPLNASIRRPGQRRVSLSSESGYQSSQMIPEQVVDNRTNNYISPARQAQQFANQRDRQRQIQHERQVQMQRQRLRQRAFQLQRQREVQLQRERERQLARERSRERERQQRELQRQREIERQRQQRQRERQRQLQRERQREVERQRQRQRERQRERERDRQDFQEEEPSINLNALVQNTQQIITFIQQLSFDDEGLSIMVAQLRQLNAIASQIRQLNGLGRNLGFRMGQVFAQRIHQLQNAIMNQIGVVLIRNFHDRISTDFERLISFSPMQGLIASIGLKKEQIQKLFPTKMAQQVDQCSICLQQIKKRQQIRQLQCKHSFHPDCIDGWLLESRRCPMCRHEQQIS